MTAVRKPSSILVHLMLGACVGLMASPVRASEFNLVELMRVLAQTKEGRASFVEKKYIGIVERPLVSSGELSFTAPDRLEKRTLKPAAELLVLDGDQLIVEQGDKRRLKLRLQEHPEIAAFVESIRGTLSGDRLALEKAYAMELRGSIDKWQLSLTPTQAGMMKLVSRIRINGTLGDVQTISFEQADGDRSDMTITKAATK